MRCHEIISEAATDWDKFWINSVERLLEPVDQDHETDLPGDGTLGFHDSLAAGWVRGGFRQGTLYLTARDRPSASAALTLALKHYMPDEVNIEIDGGEFLRLTAKQAKHWGRRF